MNTNKHNHMNSDFNYIEHFYLNRFYLDRAGTLTIHNLTLWDAGNYTCHRTGKKDLVVTLNMIGK